MPLLNYTTKVDIFTTLGQIQGQLVKHGARKILQEYDGDGHVEAVSFMIDTPVAVQGVKSLKRRMEVAERAVENLAYKRAKTLLDDDSKEAMEKIKQAELQQAERELAEERKDD